jgi:hypothetical protein
MVALKKVKEEVVEHAGPKLLWYLKYRTQIWSTVFMIIGAVGGSVATVQKYVPTLKYDNAEIERKLTQIDEMSSKLIQIQETLDELIKK